MLDESRVWALAEEELRHLPPELRSLLDAKDQIGVLREQVRADRCAVVDETYLRGISAVAAPIYDYTGRLCAVMTALGATGGFDARADGSIARAVREEAAATSVLLGYAVHLETA